MSRPEWRHACEDLAAGLSAACANALPLARFRVEDLSSSMLAREDDPRVVPYWPIGVIYRYRVRECRTHRLFGRAWLPIRRWKTLVTFGLEEMFESRHWTAKQGLWCLVTDPRVAGEAKALLERFAAAHRLKLDFASRAA